MTRLCALLLLASLGGSAAAAETAIVIPADDVIGPATADFIERGLARAEEERASVAVIELDTPGGLDPSMRSIIKAILASPVPVVAYVAPSGACGERRHANGASAAGRSPRVSQVARSSATAGAIAQP